MMNIFSAISDNLGVIGLTTGGLTMGGVVLFLLKKVPNEKISGLVYDCMLNLGNLMTLGLGKWKLTKGIWNKTIEPWFIDLLDNIVASAVNGFIAGLRSDNK